MAKITITGMSTYDFKDQQTGRQISGMSVYFKVMLNEKNGFNDSAGFRTDKLTVNNGTPLYDKMFRLTYDKPIEAEPIFDIIPGRKQPVLMDIQV